MQYRYKNLIIIYYISNILLIFDLDLIIQTMLKKQAKLIVRYKSKYYKTGNLLKDYFLTMNKKNFLYLNIYTLLISTINRIEYLYYIK